MLIFIGRDPDLRRQQAERDTIEACRKGQGADSPGCNALADKYQTEHGTPP